MGGMGVGGDFGGVLGTGADEGQGLGGAGGGGQENPASGFAQFLSGLGPAARTDNAIGGELTWQREVKGERAKIETFAVQALGLQIFPCICVHDGQVTLYPPRAQHGHFL